MFKILFALLLARISCCPKIKEVLSVAGILGLFLTLNHWELDWNVELLATKWHKAGHTVRLGTVPKQISLAEHSLEKCLSFLNIYLVRRERHTHTHRDKTLNLSICHIPKQQAWPGPVRHHIYISLTTCTLFIPMPQLQSIIWSHNGCTAAGRVEGRPFGIF